MVFVRFFGPRPEILRNLSDFPARHHFSLRRSGSKTGCIFQGASDCRTFADIPRHSPTFGFSGGSEFFDNTSISSHFISFCFAWRSVAFVSGPRSVMSGNSMIKKDCRGWEGAGITRAPDLICLGAPDKRQTRDTTDLRLIGVVFHHTHCVREAVQL